jgi:hypothetical protein
MCGIQSRVNVCIFFFHTGAVTATANQEKQDETKNDTSLLPF